MRPGGIARPNARAIARGLSFALDFSDPRAEPWLLPDRGAVIGGFNSGGARGHLKAGWGLTNSGGYWGGSGAGNTYSLDTTSGTVIVAFVPDHDSGSAGDRIMLSVGNASFPSTPGIAVSNFFGNWTAGWADGADKRVSVSAAGLYSTGEVLTAGLTWDATAQRVYMRGVEIGSGAAATYASTAGSDFLLGNYAASYPWISSSTGGILYALVFDRALSAAEMLAAERDMWWWCRQPRARPVRRTAITVVEVALTGIAATASSGSVAAGVAAAAAGMEVVAGAGTASAALAVTLSGAAITMAAGTLAYTIGFTLTGSATTAAHGTLSADPGNVSRSLTGIQMTALPGNVRVTGGTRWRPSEAQAVVPPSMVGNTLQPPPRLVGDPAADNRAIQQWLQTLYDHVIKRDNVLGRIADHENRIASLEASNDNGST